MKEVHVSVIIPSFDEMANLQKGTLDKIEHFLDKKKFGYEVIVSDDGSTDGSAEFVEKFVKDSPHFRLLKNSHLGKAGAVTKGMLEAKGKYRLFMDMDQATPIEEIDKLLPYFDEGWDVVIGSRNSNRRGAPWTRLVMARGMIFLRKLLVGVGKIGDTQCGFKMFNKKAADDLFVKLNKIHGGFGSVSGSSVSAGFDVELLYLADKKEFKIKEVPVDWLYVETRRVSPIKDSINGLMELIRIKLNDLKGVYN